MNKESVGTLFGLVTIAYIGLIYVGFATLLKFWNRFLRYAPNKA